MQYPLTTEYIQSIRDAADNLDKLANLTPVLDSYGEPYRSSGAFAVVFKMKDEATGKFYALKCFTEEQEGRAEAYKMIAEELETIGTQYLTGVQYLERELFVDSQCTSETEFPVLLMDWVDGVTMDAYIADNYKDSYAMSMLCYQFCRMASWLRSQPIAHGDIKPDNIMVRSDGSLVLVDYDGMFVPEMKGRKSPTIGTRDFSHPLRTADDFDETIDDFSLASIALSLKAIALKPALLDEYGAPDRLLFSASDYSNPAASRVLSAMKELFVDTELQNLYSLFFMSLASKSLAMVSFRAFAVAKPKQTFEPHTIYYEADEKLDIKWIDKNCVSHYFSNGKGKIRLKDDVTEIGKDAFYGCSGLIAINIPDSVTKIGDRAFRGCSGLTSINIPDSVTEIGGWAFDGCSGLTSINIPDSVTEIGEFAFSGCSGLTSINIPDSVTEIGGFAFYGCRNIMYNGKAKGKPWGALTVNGHVDGYLVYADESKSVLTGCSTLATEAVIPDSVKVIGDYAFEGCSGLTSINIPDSVTEIGYSAFRGCSGLTSIVVAKGNGKYDSRNNCNAIIETATNTLVTGCMNTVIPDSVTEIGYSAFEGCIGLTSINIPDSVTEIGYSAFEGCSGLTSIDIPDSVTEIGKHAFDGCSGLTSINIPDSVTKIGDRAFSGCSGLKEIIIPKGTRAKFEEMLQENVWDKLVERDGSHTTTFYSPLPPNIIDFF